MAKYQNLAEAVKDKEFATNQFKELTEKEAESFMRGMEAFLFAVVHQESKENLNELLKNIYSVLNPKGRLFLTSFFLNEDKISPEFSVQFAVEMMLNSNNGKVYTHSEIQNLMVQNKFKEIKRIDDIPGPATLYIAKKYESIKIEKGNLID